MGWHSNLAVIWQLHDNAWAVGLLPYDIRSRNEGDIFETYQLEEEITPILFTQLPHPRYHLVIVSM